MHADSLGDVLAPPEPVHMDSLGDLDEIFAAAARSIEAWPGAEPMCGRPLVAASPSSAWTKLDAEASCGGGAGPKIDATTNPGGAWTKMDGEQSSAGQGVETDSEPVSRCDACAPVGCRAETIAQAWSAGGSAAGSVGVPCALAGVTESPGGMGGCCASTWGDGGSDERLRGDRATGLPLATAPGPPGLMGGGGMAGLLGGVAQSAAARVATRVGGLRGFFGGGGEEPREERLGAQALGALPMAERAAPELGAPGCAQLGATDLGTAGLAAPDLGAPQREVEARAAERPSGSGGCAVAGMAAPGAEADMQAVLVLAPAAEAMRDSGPREVQAPTTGEEARGAVGPCAGEGVGSCCAPGQSEEPTGRPAPRDGMLGADGPRVARMQAATAAPARPALPTAATGPASVTAGPSGISDSESDQIRELRQVLEASERRAALLHQQQKSMMQRLSAAPAATPGTAPSTPRPTAPTSGGSNHDALGVALGGPPIPDVGSLDGPAADDLESRLRVVCAAIEAHVAVAEGWAAERAHLRARCEQADRCAHRALALLRATGSVATAIAAEAAAREHGNPSSPGTLACKAFGGLPWVAGGGKGSLPACAGHSAAYAGQIPRSTPSPAAVASPFSAEMPEWLRGAEVALHHPGEAGGAATPVHRYARANCTPFTAGADAWFTPAPGGMSREDAEHSAERSQLIEIGRASFTQLRGRREQGDSSLSRAAMAVAAGTPPAQLTLSSCYN